jgi:hypothetical protein
VQAGDIQYGEDDVSAQLGDDGFVDMRSLACGSLLVHWLCDDDRVPFSFRLLSFRLRGFSLAICDCPCCPSLLMLHTSKKKTWRLA